MFKKILVLFIFINLSSTFARDTGTEKSLRFEDHQLSFSLSESDGAVISCEHKLLSHVPWFRVYCGDREFTVDVWVQLAHSQARTETKVTLMYSVSEGIKSSGEKLVQFNNHFTDIVVSELNLLKRLTSSIDVRNGLASLNVRAEL